ncbi:MAG: hypothetical protein NZ522_06485, partial [Chitinophagales bacterium]|nr:hypothetical protein [Chitinophagales bacterium]
MKYCLPTIIFCSAFLSSCLAQYVTYDKGAGRKAKELYEQADRALAFGNAKEASDFLKQAVASQHNFIDAWYLLGVIQLDNLKDYKDAV